MDLSFEQALVEVWRQVLVEDAKAVKVGRESYPVRRTPKRGLRQVDFVSLRLLFAGRPGMTEKKRAQQAALL